MILISSSAYVINEFQAELGKIPPCFLPIGNKKLIEHQVEALSDSFPHEKIVLSLPESYALNNLDEKLFISLGLVLVFVPDDFTLSESIAYVLNVVDIPDVQIKVLFGDTLVKDLTFDKKSDDILGVAISEDSYNWRLEGYEEGVPIVWCGFFSLTSRTLFLKCLALKRRDFIEAIQLYRNTKDLQLHRFNHWYDLGHVNTYFRSRAAITTQRAFNELRIEDGVLYKTGSPSIKIEAEAQWFKNIPPVLKVFSPPLIDHYANDSGEIFYALEYLPNMPLNELFVHGKNTFVEWNLLFCLISRFIQNANKISVPTNKYEQVRGDFVSLITEKTFTRLETYADEYCLDINKPNVYGTEKLPSLKEISQNCIDRVLALNSCLGVVHGDLCLSNILYDSRSRKIKLIDPRGMTLSGEFSIYGDQKYDIAKLAHSIIGLYDHIIAGRYQITGDLFNCPEIIFDVDQRIINIQEHFIKFDFLGEFSIKRIMPLVVLLFLSMLPLHKDRPDRQKAFLVNSLRLYKEYC